MPVAERTAEAAGVDTVKALDSGLDKQGPTAERTAATLGETISQQVADAIERGANPSDSVAAGIADIGRLDGSAEGAGVGESIAIGIADGIDENTSYIEDAAGKAVTAAEKAAKNEAKAKSPSLLFRAIGRDLGEGMRLGLGDLLVPLQARGADTARAVALGVERAERPTLMAETMRRRDLGRGRGGASGGDTTTTNITIGGMSFPADSRAGELALALFDEMGQSHPQLYGARSN